MTAFTATCPRSAPAGGPFEASSYARSPAAWSSAPGHRPKLELLGKDEPFLRPSNGTFSVRVSEVDVVLPTAERRQGDCAG